MEETILIRKSTEREFPLMASLERECFSAPWSEAMIRSSAEGRDFLFLSAFVGDAFAGHIGLICLPPEIEIANLAVSPALRRRGVGTALLRAVFRMAKERAVDTVYLEVRASNRGAQALYEAEGFGKIGIRRGFYEKPHEDAFVYQKIIR